MSRASSKGTLGGGCLALFGVPFAAVGTFMAWKLAAMLWLGVAAQWWPEVDAKLTRVELERRHGGEGGSTREVHAEYRYEFDGQVFQGDRVSLLEEADNIGPHQQRLYDRLKESFDAEQPVACYVDPSDPSRSLLDRQVRPLMVVTLIPFAVLFPGVGYGMIVLGWWSARESRAEEARREGSPDQPWRWHRDWAAGEIIDNGRRKWLGAALFATFWNLISWPAVGPLCFGAEEQSGILLFLLFPLSGIGMIVYAAYEFRRYRLMGESRFRLATFPGVVGGRLAGVIVASDRIASVDAVRLKLTCQESVRSGEDNSTKLIWQDERVVDRLLDAAEPGRVGVPVMFVIPSDARPSDDGDHISWHLKAEAELPGPDYRAEFEVPVFVTDESAVGVEAPLETLSEYEREVSLEALLEKEKIRRVGLPDGGVRYKSTAWRFGLTAVGTLIPAIGILVGAFVSAKYGPWFLTLTLSLSGAGMFLIGLHYALAYSELTIRGDRWTVRNGWRGFPARTREFGVSKILGIHAAKAGTNQSGSVVYEYRHIVAKVAPGKAVTIVRSIVSRPCQRKLIAELCERAGIDKPPA